MRSETASTRPSVGRIEHYVSHGTPAQAGGLTLSHEQIAHVCHEANRALQIVTGDPQVSDLWGSAPAWQRQSAVSGVAAAAAGATPAELHDAWCRHKRAEGWTYGPVKDPEAKTHPCLVPYDQLPAEQRAKDVLFRAVVGALAGV